MCLRSIEKQSESDNRVRNGYKVFRVAQRGGLHFEFDHYGNSMYGPLIRKNRWLRARPTAIAYNIGLSYDTGFHIFTNKRDARIWMDKCNDEVIVRVSYRKARILGTQGWRENNLSVVIADEMFVPGD
jgi:hypothetical protein